MEPNWLNAHEARAWRAFIDAHHRLEVHLTRRLQESGLSGADYEVLAVLSRTAVGGQHSAPQVDTKVRMFGVDIG
jgi:hypothetical protein